MSRSARYLIWYGCGLIGSLLLCAGFAIVVDPYYVVGTPVIAGINALHPYANDQMIAARSHLAERMRPRTLLLGNSRVEAGFDPASAAWPEAMQPVFNAGLPGLGLESMRPIVEAALRGGRLRHVVVAVEFLDTIGDGHSSVQPIRLTVPPLEYWRDQAHDWLTATLTLGALVDSARTVLGQRSSSMNSTRPNGASDLGEYVAYVREAGGAALFDHKLAEYKKRFATYTAPDFSQPEQDTTFRALAAILDAADAAGCSVQIIIYPYHAAVLDLMRAEGLWPSFEEFKRALVQVVWARHPGTRIVDFSGYDDVTTEERPPDQPGLTMHWYWEPGHFRTSLGDKMIDRLFGNGSFGRELRPDSVEAALAAIRVEQQARLNDRRAER